MGVGFICSLLLIPQGLHKLLIYYTTTCYMYKNNEGLSVCMHLKKKSMPFCQLKVQSYSNFLLSVFGTIQVSGECSFHGFSFFSSLFAGAKNLLLAFSCNF